MWRTITEEQLKIPASVEILREFALTKPELIAAPKKLLLKRFIRGFGRQEFSMRSLPGLFPGMEIEARVNLFRAPCLDVSYDVDGERLTFTLEPIRRDEAGFDVSAALIGEEYKAVADNAAGRAFKQIQKDAYGTDSLRDAGAARASGARAYAHIDPMADVKAMSPRLYMPRRGREFVTNPPVREAQLLSIAAAAMRLRRMLTDLGVDWTERQMEHLMRAYPGGAVPPDDLEPLARRICTPAEVTDLRRRRCASPGEGAA